MEQKLLVTSRLFMLNENTKGYLLKMGWYPSRSIDIQDIKTTLAAQEFLINAMSDKFLKEFGGLSGLVPRENSNDLHQISFDILSIARNYFSEWANDVYSPLLNEDLCLVGSAYDGHLQLYVSEFGKLYGAFDGYLALFGQNYYEGLNQLFSDTRGKTIDLNLENE